jgi:predicted hotdog family 3-hydroxylacyl-ACP dehydratase
MRSADPRIALSLPHAGAMCLLDTIVEVGPGRISCEAPPPGANHPLAVAGVIPSVVAAEYAAQASAVHGHLIEPEGTVREGMLAKISDMEVLQPAIPKGCGPLKVIATLLGRSIAGCMYSFEVGTSDQCIARGRIMVAFKSVTASK